MKDLDLTRRSFLGGAAASMALAGAGILAGCAPTTPSTAQDALPSTASNIDDISWDGEYDIIVCGAGMAGHCAAITVIDEDDSATCLLLEKGSGPSGNSSFAAGYTLYADNADDVFEYLQAMDGRAQSGDDVLRAFAEGLVENKDWFNKLGAQEEWLYRQLPGTSVEDALQYLPYDFPEMPHYDALGSINFTGENGSPATTMEFLQNQLDQRAGDRLTYLASTPLEELVQDPATKTIVGVIANGQYFRARRGVILCTGGFEMNQDMLFNFTGVRKAYPSVETLNTGDGIRAAQKVGADLWHIRDGQMFWASPRKLDDSSFLQREWDSSVKQHGITVGTNGRRFLMDYDGQMTCLDQGEPGGDLSRKVGWRHAMTQWGGQWVVAMPIPEETWFIFDQAGCDAGVFADIDTTNPVADGWAYSAPTVEELAEHIGVPTDELSRTVQYYNQFCEDGFDPAFYRPAESLTALVTPPYYAMRCVPQFDNTNGGPRRSAKGEVLDLDGNPIPHLYECGEIGSVWGEYFQGAGDYADCAAFGRISVRNALANVE